MTDTELLDALEHYAWRVWSVDNPKGWTIQVDAYGGPVLGEGPTVREALAQAMGKVALPARHCGECTEEMVPELVTMERCPVCGDVSYRQALTGRAE